MFVTQDRPFNRNIITECQKSFFFATFTVFSKLCTRVHIIHKHTDKYVVNL